MEEGVEEGIIGCAYHSIFVKITLSWHGGGVSMRGFFLYTPQNYVNLVRSIKIAVQFLMLINVSEYFHTV